jgi:FkbM family methyltransferase
MSLKSRLKRFLLPRLRARGHLLIPEWRLPDLPLEEHLRALIARYDVDVVVDVGANFGQFRDTVREGAGFEGPIVSFEPVSRFRSLLETRRRDDPAWHVERFALGNAHETAVIHVMQSPGLSSLKDPDLEAMQTLLPAPERAGVESEETIEVRPLDEIAASHPVLGRAERALLKSDTQGFDLEVLRGARAFLARTMVIQVELSVLPVYANAPHYLDVINELQSLGFDLSGMFPVTLDPHLRVIEFDGIFVRHPATGAGTADLPRTEPARTTAV